MTTTIVVPLRERLERAVAEADGDNAELATMVRGIYREWKTQRIDEHLDDVARTAFGRGALAAVMPGTQVCWMVDPNGPACPDAEDNALAGAGCRRSGVPHRARRRACPRGLSLHACVSAPLVSPGCGTRPIYRLVPLHRRGPSRFSDKGRIALIAVAVLMVGVLLFGRFFAGFYTDYLWFDSVGRAGVFSTVLRSKLLMFFLFGGTFVALAVLNLVIADRLAPSAFSANTHPLVERFHEFFGHRLRAAAHRRRHRRRPVVRCPGGRSLAGLVDVPQQQRFGIDDAQFGHDVGFYMFRLPFITFVLDWLFAALVFITLLVVATHVLSGGIIIQPPRPKVRRATKAHVAVLLAVLAVRQGRRLLAHALRAHQRLARVRARSAVLGRQGTAAGCRAADVDRPAGRRPVPLHAADQLVAHSRSSRRRCGPSSH